MTTQRVGHSEPRALARGEESASPHRVSEFSSMQAPHSINIPEGARQLIVEDGFVATPASSATAIRVGAGGTLVYNWNVLASRNHLRTLTIELAARARAEVYGIVFGQGKHRVQLRLQQHHTGVSSQSGAWLRAIVQDQAQVEIAGLITIDASAPYADAYLESRAIVLSETAQADMIPGLEILARDVQAEHAAASGPIDPEQLFYLAARGVGEHAARTLVLAGFLNTLLDRLPAAADHTIVKARWNEMMEKIA